MGKLLKQNKIGYHHGNLRVVLLTTARDLLEETGAASLCLRELSRRAGVSHAAPYRHFRDKQALLKSLIIEGYELIKLAEDSKQTSTTLPKEKLFIAMTNYVEFGLAYPELHQLIFGIQNNSLTDDEVRSAGKACFDQFVAIVKEALPRAKKNDARFVALSLWSHAHGVLLLTPNPRNKERGVCDFSGENAAGYVKTLRYGMEALVAGSFGQKWKNPYLF